MLKPFTKVHPNNANLQNIISYRGFAHGPYWWTSVPRLPILNPPASKTRLCSCIYFSTICRETNIGPPCI